MMSDDAPARRPASDPAPSDPGTTVPGSTRGPARLLDIVTYPGVMAATVALHGAGVAAGVGVTIMSYLAVAVGACAIIGLEQFRPERTEWRPDASSVTNDALFLVVVQMVLPIMVGGGVALALAGLGSGIEQGLQGWWPHGWPIVAQVVAMLVVADFWRYWFHRAFHRWPALWSYHAVHHSPPRLYWLNVGRFHPVDKGVQLLVDTIPFILVGVGQEVLAGYLVFYAVNGFFQHSNARVRLGWLNHLISGPELHRWHHSRLIAESDTNFGNNLIVWDRLFGTRFLPTDREVGELGLINRAYPRSFWAQLAAPFTPGLDKEAA